MLNQDPRLITFGRNLRKSQTEPERILWSTLRSRRFQSIKFRRQHPFELYILDFYCHEFKLVIELDGGQHNTPESRQYDKIRTDFLTQRGLTVMRFWNDDIIKDRDLVIEAVFRKIQELKTLQK